MCENLLLDFMYKKLALSRLLNVIGAISVLCVILVLELMHIEFWFRLKGNRIEFRKHKNFQILGVQFFFFF
jgi:hypothetical protein